MTTTTPESRARIAYTAYGKNTGFKDPGGQDLPAFDELPEQFQQAWVASAGVIWDLATNGWATV